MKIISCSIPGRSLMVQFEPAASAVLEAHATHLPAAPSHGLLLGWISGDDPKCLHIRHIQPVFGLGDSTGPGPSATLTPAHPPLPLITLGYYTIRHNSDTLDQNARDFLADSLPPSASLAVVITGNPEGRMLTQFYLRERQGTFGPFPDHREVLIPQEIPRESTIPARFVAGTAAPPDVLQILDRPRLPWRGIGAAAALGIAATAILATRIRPPVHPQSSFAQAATKPPLTLVPVLPQPDFVLPVKPVRLIEEPPEVAIWYPVPAASARPPAVTAARHALLVHPIVSRGNLR